MKIKILTLALLLAISTVSFGQELFKVLASRGSNTVASNGATTPLIIGKKLLKGDKLTVSEGGYVGLAHVSGKTIEIKKGGSYDVGTLVAEVSNQNASSTQKYVNYVSNQMTSGNQNMTQNRSQYMAVTGSVERGSNDIKVYSREKEEVYNGQILLKWNAIPNAQGYVVVFEDMFDEEIFKTETKETELAVDVTKLNIKSKEGNTIKYTIYLKNDKTIRSSDKLFITYVAADKEQQVSTELAAIQKENPEANALNKIVLAGFYEEKGLILNAMEQYQEAIKLEPEVEDYKVAYGMFLERNGLVPVAATK